MNNQSVLCYKKKSTNEITCGYYKDFKELRNYESNISGEFDINIWNDFVILKEGTVRSKLGYFKFVKKCHQHNFYDKTRICTHK